MKLNIKISLFFIICIQYIGNLFAQDYFDNYQSPTMDFIFSEIKKKDSSLKPEKAKYIIVDSTTYRISNRIELNFALHSFFTDEILDIEYFPKAKFGGKRHKAKIVITTDDRPFYFITQEMIQFEIENHDAKKPKILVYNGKQVKNKSVPEFLSELKNYDKLDIMIFQNPYPDVEFGNISKYGLIKISSRE